MKDRTSLRGRRLIVAMTALAVAAVVAAALLWPRSAPPETAPTTAAAGESATPSATPSPTPVVSTPAGPPADTRSYDLAGLPAAQVFTVNPQTPLDDAPDAPTLPFVAQARDLAPVFAEPGGEPVAVLPREQQHGGAVVPVVQREEHWVKVLLSGRQGVPPDGSAAQIAGWLRTGDVEITPQSLSVEVSISDGTIDIVDGGTRERVATSFGWGTAATPTPHGRSYIMTTAVTDFAYTRGHPIVYLSVQSPTLAGFDGAEVAVTAFHYHDVRDGAISNGCIRVDAEAITRLAQLPPGTPVHIRP